jgi:hypothetical protein
VLSEQNGNKGCPGSSAVYQRYPDASRFCDSEARIAESRHRALE